jgi:hypothetical protein
MKFANNNEVVMKLQEGKRYIRCDGAVTVPMKRNPNNPLFPFITKHLKYNQDGVCYSSNTCLNIMCEYVEYPTTNMNIINFWEAREAAQQGKEVRLVSRNLEYSAEEFLNTIAWNSYAIEGEWEIVETKRVTQYYSIFSKGHDAWLGSGHKTKELANSSRPEKIGIIAITVDENGKLVEVEQVQ